MSNEQENGLEVLTEEDLFVRLAAAVSTCPAVAKKHEGVHDAKYASINDVLVSVRQALEVQDMEVLQPAFLDEEGNIRVDTMIVCLRSGQRLTFPGVGQPVKADPQAVGSTITYFRRYGLQSLFGLMTTDDDGEHAHRAATRPTTRTGAEQEIRAIIGRLTREDRTAFQADFVDAFQCKLTELPESRHADALEWAKWWLTGGEEATPDNDDGSGY